MANEPDRDKRERLDRVRVELTEEHLNPLHAEGVQIVRDGVERLEAPNYAELYRRLGFRLDDLADQCRALLDSTEKVFEESADKLFRDRVGIGLDEAKRWDVIRTFRAPEWDPQFPAEKMLPALEATLSDMGVDLRSQENVELDVEQRPKKSPRAFCAPIEIPGRVVLVIQPMGGADDWRALFHEAGHTEHYANTSPNLLMEEKRLGDVAVTEGWAMLMQHLTDDPAWLTRRLDFPRPDEFEREGVTQLLYMVRRYSAKLLYELEFHQADDPTKLSNRYVEILGDALKIEPAAADYLSDIDSSFYVTGYLRSWAFEAQFRTHLRERYGNDWFAKREAGSLVRELWETGMSMTADEMLERGDRPGAGDGRGRPAHARRSHAEPVVSEDLVPRDELQAAISARNELGEDLEPALVDAFVERIEKRIAERQGESEQSLRRKREHQKEMVLGSMALSIPLFALAAIFTGLAGVIVVCATLAVIAVVASR